MVDTSKLIGLEQFTFANTAKIIKTISYNFQHATYTDWILLVV